MSKRAYIFDMDGELVSNSRFHVLAKTCNLSSGGV